MATKFTAEVRLTHTYIDDYSHMDKWGQAFKFKALASKVVDEGNGYDETGNELIRVIGDKKADQELQARTLASHYSHYGCTHQYDCCGCHGQSASVRKVKRGVFSVFIHHYRDY